MKTIDIHLTFASATYARRVVQVCRDAGLPDVADAIETCVQRQWIMRECAEAGIPFAPRLAAVQKFEKILHIAGDKS